MSNKTPLASDDNFKLLTITGLKKKIFILSYDTVESRQRLQNGR